MSSRPKRKKRLLLAWVWAAASWACLPAQAEVSGFWAWRPEPNGVRYVLPKIPGLDPARLAENYLRSLKKSPVYGPMQYAQELSLSTAPKTFSQLPDSSSMHPNVAVVINRPGQMTPKVSYLRVAIESFERKGPNLFVIPVGISTTLSREDLRQFRTRLNRFDGQLGVGGDDVHPHGYGKRDVSETRGDISLARDREQIAFMTEYLKNGKGRVFHICGSMQRAAVADGYCLIPDIGHLSPIAQESSFGPVMVEVIAKDGSELAKAAGATRFYASTYHHSAVNPSVFQDPSRPPASVITAYDSLDGKAGRIVKALEFPENAGFATQFHPEFRNSLEEERIIDYVVTGWKMRGRYSSDQVVQCTLDHLRLLRRH